MRWTFPDETVEAPAQLLGLYSPADSTWTWAWASRGVPSGLRVASEGARAWGDEHGHAFLAEPTVVTTEEQVADLVAVVFLLSDATGFYRAPAGQVVAHMTFGPVIITPHEGEDQRFEISVE